MPTGIKQLPPELGYERITINTDSGVRKNKTFYFRYKKHLRKEVGQKRFIVSRFDPDLPDRSSVTIRSITCIRALKVSEKRVSSVGADA
jgi:hypothetical protein